MFAFLISCGDASKTTNSTNGTSTKTTTSTTADSGKLTDPKGSIEYQFDLVKAGDYDKLKDCLTDRIKGNLTKEMVDKAKVDAANYTMDDLYAAAEDGEMDGKKTKKVKMKNGRTLTTLVETNGKWLADTIWFK
jgi:hypothetical protein